MRLLTKITLNLLAISIFVFLFGMVAFYYLLRQQVDQNINRELGKRKVSISKQLDAAHSSIQAPINLNERVLITPIFKPQVQESIKDTLLLDPETHQYTLYRQLGFVKNINQKPYYIQIFKSLEETDRLIIRIILIMNILVFLIIISLLIVNRYSSRRGWRAFYDTIDKIRNYDVNSHESFTLSNTDIREFEDLNRVLLTMTDRIKNDYLNLKEYIENASHEIQTPLAIISSKMELLLQSGDMAEKQYKTVADAYEASNRLSRLNKTLILMAKIENRQFPESKPVHLASIVNTQLDYLEDLIHSRKIKVHKDLDEQMTVQMNSFLAEILLVNLIKNAVRHNSQGGELSIELTKNSFQISNSGAPLRIEPELLFKRFYKSSSSPESLGLGLAIVHKICQMYGYRIEYNYIEGMHVISIKFQGN